MAKQIMGPENDVFYELRDHGKQEARGTAPEAPAKNGFFAKLFGVLALVCFIGTFGLGFFGDTILRDGGEWALVAMFGATFLSFGLCMTASGHKPGLIFAAVGACVAAASVGYGLGSPAFQAALMETAVPAALLSCFILAGLAMMAVPPILARKQAASHPVETRATVKAKHERISRDSDGHRSRTWVLDWEYYAGGRMRVYHSRTGRSPERREPGDPGVLYLSETDPDDVWEKPQAPERVLFLAIGAMFFAAGAAAMALLFMAGS